MISASTQEGQVPSPQKTLVGFLDINLVIGVCSTSSCRDMCELFMTFRYSRNISIRIYETSQVFFSGNLGIYVRIPVSQRYRNFKLQTFFAFSQFGGGGGGIEKLTLAGGPAKHGQTDKRIVK